MPRAIVRTMLAAFGGAGAGLLLVMLAYTSRADIALEMDRDLPRFASGFHAIERDGDRTFAWTSDRAVIRLAGLDRRVDWTCTISARGIREPLPDLTLAYDGTGSETGRLTHDYRDVTVRIPARPEQSGLTLTVVVAPTFVPGPHDPRTLGAQVDWLRCSPEGRVLPPPAAMQAGAIATGAFGLAAVLAGAPVPVAAVVIAVSGAGFATLLSTGGAAFGTYPSLVTVIAALAAGALVVAAWIAAIGARARLAGPALAVASATAVLAALKLAALAHPMKAVVDALFQAHRLQWVQAGRYFFTQPLPDGVQFPYAIGLYVTAMPWASLVTDHVLLLRAVVVVAEALAGIALYLVVVRGFGDRLAGLIAVLLFHVVPLPFVVVGNGNLTNAFAQSAAVMALAAAALMPSPLRGWQWPLRVAILTALTTLAFLSHVTTVMLLAGTLGAIVVAYVVVGGRDLQRPAAAIALATALATVVAVGLYYRHFDEVFEQARARVRAPQSASAPNETGEPEQDRPAVLVRPLAWHERAADTVRQTTRSIGWPVLVLATAGVGGLAAAGWRRQVPLFVAAWGAAWLIFLVGGTLTRVDTQYQRYAAELVGRINLASYPVAVVLAAIGASRLWRARQRARAIAAAVLVAAALVIGIGMWKAWFA